MKKFISILLAVALLVPMVLVPSFANSADNTAPVTQADSLESAFAEGTNSLVVFVTGIGQSYSYLFDQSYVDQYGESLQDFEVYGDLIAKGEYQSKWNLFNSFDEAFSDPNTIINLVSVVVELLTSAVFRTDLFVTSQVEAVIRGLFKFNLVDENGNANPRVVTPRYPMSVSEYPSVTLENGSVESEAKSRFYSSIPCKDIAKEKFGEDYEKYLYVFNYSAFSYTSNNVEAMKEFIDTILASDNAKELGATDVVLVPMSMGASVVTAYMDAYPTVAENHIRRVVSIVGAWDGSDVVADLLTGTYCDNSADLFYNGLLSDLIGEPWGYVVNLALRIFPKPVLRAFVDKAIGAIATELFCSTPSLCNLIPIDKYDGIKHLIKSDAVREEADAFQAAKKKLDTTMENLEKEGVTFSFISGYGLPFGAITADYSAFGFMKSAAETNSDEIINIDSTAPGTSFVPAGTKFEDTEGRELSPDGEIDISTTTRKESTWFFYQQKHELEYNNVAIALAIELATGNVKTVADCDNLEEDGYYFPQFNGARNTRNYIRYNLPDLERYCAETGYEITPAQQKVLDDANAMMANPKCDPEVDDPYLAAVEDMMVEIGIYEAPTEPTTGDKVLNGVLKLLNDVVYAVVGPQGYADPFFN
ncbi:MAG: hypothetical protein IIW48_07165 [Clostridia bacterium]|nr:hypothetical protein [Clostridia bacterium]